MHLAKFRPGTRISWPTMASDGSQKPAWYGQPFSYMLHPVGGQSQSYGEVRGKRLPKWICLCLSLVTSHSHTYQLCLHNECRQPGINETCIALTGDFCLLLDC